MAGDDDPSTSNGGGNAHSVLQLPVPGVLSLKGDLVKNYNRFKSSWDNFLIASQLDKASEARKLATLKTCIGEATLDIIESFEYAQGETESLALVFKKLELYFCGEKSEIYKRYKFNVRDMKSEEAYDGYLAALRELAKTCNYGTLKDSLIRDRIVVGTKIQPLRRKYCKRRSSIYSSVYQCAELTRQLRNKPVKWQVVWPQLVVVKESTKAWTRYIGL